MRQTDQPAKGNDFVRGRKPSVTWIGWLQALAVVVVMVAGYLILQNLWLALRVPADAPAWAVRRPMRQFFGGVLAVAALLTPTLFRRADAARARPFMRVGVLMTLAGLAGLWIYLPLTSSLESAGGFLFDPGHTISESAPTGGLWLVLCLTGWVPYLAGFRRVEHFGHAEQLALIFTTLTALYVLLYLVILTGLYVTAV